MMVILWEATSIAAGSENYCHRLLHLSGRNRITIGEGIFVENPMEFWPPETWLLIHC